MSRLAVAGGVLLGIGAAGFVFVVVAASGLLPRPAARLVGTVVPLMWLNALVSAVVVYVDARRLGVNRLRLARVRLGSIETQSAGEWCTLVLLFWVAGLPWYLGMRPTLARRVVQAHQLGYFRNWKEAKRSRKANRQLPNGSLLPGPSDGSM